MPQLNISIGKNKYSVNASHNQLLSDVFKQSGIQFAMPCAGNHTCGKCKVQVTKNKNGLSMITNDERCLLGTASIDANMRLACFARIIDDCSIIAEQRKSEDFSIQTAFAESSISVNSNSLENSYGLSVDIGTTTIVSYLYSLKDGMLLSTVGEMNNQSAYGADVISRIDYSNQNDKSKLHFSIINQLTDMFNKNLEIASKEKAIFLNDISKLVITGNTTMLHFLMDYPASGIAVSPFTAYSLFGINVDASTIFSTMKNTKLYLPRCVGAYVGADAICSILASDMTGADTDKSYMMADIGTNGEMALFHKGKLYTCSTAAGPAFEGAGIKMGMTAKNGAITDIEITDDQVKCSTIGGNDPIGICGTGLINCLAKMLDYGVVDESGLINDEEKRFASYDENDSIIKLGNSNVVITQRDIRQLQLAKSAIHAGILTLCHECSISIEEIDTLYLCGGFGSVIDSHNASRIGLIPSEVEEKVVPLGNGAGLGASLILCSDQKLAEVERIAELATEIPLSASPFFMEKYIDCMMF